MRKPSFYFAAGVLTVIAIIGGMWSLGWLADTMLGNLFAGDDSGMFQVNETSPSPNGDRTATLYIGMGGGAAGWCYQRVDINEKGDPFDLERARKGGDFLVFSASCGSKVELVWESNTKLHISYSNIENGVSTYQNPLSRNKLVQITYLPK